MNLNSQFSFYPQQPNDPSDADRHNLAYLALTDKGWPEDFDTIKKLLSPPPEITKYSKPGECRGLRVGVLGGGLAGFSAAYELRKLGFDITIYDALEDRIGGRIYTYYFDDNKIFYHDFGAMRIPVTHETVWHYMKLFKLPSRPFIQYNPNAFVSLKNVSVRNDRSGENVKKYIYPKYKLKDWERAESWQKLLSMGTDDHLLKATTEERSEIIQTKPEYSAKTQLWSDKTVIKMMEAAGLSQEAISLLSNFSPLISGNLYNSFIDYIQESYPADVTYLYEIPGGMVRLPMAFYNSFSEPAPYSGIPAEYTGTVAYKAGCWVNGLYSGITGNKVTVKYQALKSKENMYDEFDFIVCAIPFSTLRNVKIDPLFSNIKMRAIREVNYTPAQKSLMLCKERFWEKEWIAGGGSFTDLPISSIWYPSDHAQLINDPKNAREQLENLPWQEPGVIVGTYNFNLDTTRLANQPAEKRFEETKRELEMVHGLTPGALDDIIGGYKLVNWNQDPAFRGALCFFSSEQKKLFSYGMALPEYNDRVFFAGEHISPVHRWMQGSLQTGMQAANDIAAACKNKRVSAK